ncbi:GNAT family N-acetyltransferase [Aeromicrobium massiliense]|uniref:GNAT family N-acetyltransferase n=1 Tax=Aeromicrobium massiliense TaxID=1464554 RepID=UPI0002DD1E8D|nr:GNAT family N-acetyltransferase [Aeromicrobium massiliense]
MDHQPVVRAATPADHPDLLRVWRRAVEATHDFLAPADVDFYEQAVAAYLPQMADLRVIEGPDGRPAGFVAQDDGEVHMLFVDPAVHGRGLGTLLLDAVAAGQPALRLDVNEQNASGRRFYAAKGFTEVGRSPVDGEGRPFPLLHLRRG